MGPSQTLLTLSVLAVLRRVPVLLTVIAPRLVPVVRGDGSGGLGRPSRLHVVLVRGDASTVVGRVSVVSVGKVTVEGVARARKDCSRNSQSQK